MNILIYHRFGDNRNIYYRKREDFIDDLKSFVGHKITDPYKMDGDVMITIDDGNKSAYETACPLLRGFGYPAVLFIITGFIGKKGYMTWKQVKELSEHFCIESHTHNHLPLMLIPNEKVEYELKTSRDLIAKKVGKEPRFLSLPGGNGAGDERIIKIARKLGYKGIFTSAKGSNDPLDIYFLKRNPPNTINNFNTKK